MILTGNSEADLNTNALSITAKMSPKTENEVARNHKR